MQATSRKKTTWIDLIGGALMAALLGLAIYLGLYGDQGARADINSSINAVADVRHNLQMLQQELDKQEGILGRREQELAKSGHLPESAPVEQDLQQFSQLAEQNHLAVSRVTPLAPANYPGLVENRYAFEAHGTMLDLASFLNDVESASFWADVSHLSIEVEKAADQTEGGVRCAAKLTISLFTGDTGEQKAVGETEHENLGVGLGI